MAAALDRALRSAQGLLSVPGFVAAAQDLLGDEDAAVRARAVAMLEGRVEFMERGGGGGDGFSRDEASLIVDMVPELAATLREEKKKKEEEEEEGGR